MSHESIMSEEIISGGTGCTAEEAHLGVGLKLRLPILNYSGAIELG